MKPKKTNGEGKTNGYDVPIEITKSITKFCMHVIDSERFTPAGKCNLMMLFIFGIAIILKVCVNTAIPLFFYLFIVLGWMSVMISSTTLVNIKATQFKNKFRN